MVEKNVNNITVLELFDIHISSLKENKRIGYAKVFSDTKAQIEVYIKKKDIIFSQIDVEWLIKFEMNLRQNNLSDNAISIRMRTLRTME